MERFAALREQFLDFIYICCAIFHGVFVQGTTLPFLEQLHNETKRYCLIT